MPAGQRGQRGQQAVLHGGRLEGGEQHDERRAAGRARRRLRRAATSPPRRGPAPGRPSPRPPAAAASRCAAARTRARTCRSPARKSTLSPAREASAASSSAASIAESSRGTSSTRPADVREVSRTSSTRRCRSGCQVRTTTLRARALARQSMLRTSSPSTYSRRESNSVPWPRTRTAARPSSSRSRASRLGRCLRDVERRQHPHATRHLPRRLPGGEAQRAGAAHRHPVRAPVAAPGRRERRGQPDLVAGGEVEAVPVARRAGGRLPGVAQHPADPPVARCWRPAGRCWWLALPDLAGRPARSTREAARAARRAARPRPPASADREQPPGRRAGRPDAPRARRTPSSSSSGTRPVRLIAGRAPSRRRRCSTWPTVDALELGLRAQPEPVRERGRGQRLDVVGGHERPALQPRPGPAGAQQRGGAARADPEAQRRRDAGWPGRCRRRSRSPRGTPRRSRTAAAAGLDVGGAGDRAHAGRGDVVRVEPVGVPLQDLQLRRRARAPAAPP